MIHSVRFTAVLDTNIIFPIVIRDLLFWFAFYELYTPKWSKNIFDEWERVMIERGVGKEMAKKQVNRANLAFPDAMVMGYEELMVKLNLPDENDKHVLAAAIKANADIIITNNIKDFPQQYIASFGLNVINADDFLTEIIDLNHDLALKAFKEMVSHKKKPEMNEFQVLKMLENNGLINTADYLKSLIL